MAKKIRAALGPEALRIDHIGSTAVPGLPAKNVIDIQVAVADLGDADALAAAGFRPFADVVDDHRPPGDERPDAEWANASLSSRRTNVARTSTFASSATRTGGTHCSSATTSARIRRQPRRTRS
jgi:GrpB-like predicted nucleotidyltransferase (UPF0157 family)